MKLLRLMQGLFVPFVRVGSADLCEGLTSISQQIRCIQLKHLLRITMYNLSLPDLMYYSTMGCLYLCNSGPLGS